LPDGSVIPALNASPAVSPERTGAFYAIGADIARKQVRVFDPGELLSPPAGDGVLARLHVTAQMQPGVSGGGLVDAAGRLVGIAVGGGDGRFEAIPLGDVSKLLDLRGDPQADRVTEELGSGFEDCAALLDASGGGQSGAPGTTDLTTICSKAANHGQLLKAGRIWPRPVSSTKQSGCMDKLWHRFQTPSIPACHCWYRSSSAAGLRK
jgi:hypothetical protein